MGGQSVPSSTAQFQQVATGIWGSPEATAMAKPILKPAMASIKERQDTAAGFAHGDPEQTRKFLGLPPTATQDEAVHAIAQLNKPVTSTAQFQQPIKTAARGGIMDLHDEESTKDPRKFAKGGSSEPSTPKDITAAQAAKLDRYQQLIDSNKKLNPSQQRQYDSWTAQRNTFQDYTKQQGVLQQAAADAGITNANAFINKAGYFGFDPTAYAEAAKRGDLAGTTTNPLYAQAIRQLQSMQAQPSQFGQATQAYTDALSGLKGAASYTPQQVQAAQAAAAQANRGDIRDIAAQQAQVERYGATDIVPTARETGVTTAAPGSWTQPGTAAQYMSPYMQNVVDIQKRESMRDYQKLLGGLGSQAAKAKAYGGTRQAVESSEARRNQAQKLADIQAQGLQQAYQQGMGQFQAEQGLGAQVGMSNTAQINQLKSQYMQMGLTEAQANQAAQNAASQFGAAAQNQAYNNYVAQQLAAQQANQGMDWNTVNLNTSNQQAANVLNAQLAQQAALANQTAGLQANQQNIGAYSQMGNMGQGLGALGTQIGNYGQNIANMWGQAGGTLQNLGTNWYNQQTQNAANVLGAPASLGGQGISILGGMGGGQSGTQLQTTKQG